MQINLEELLKAAHQRELERMPKQHSQRTPDCPPIGYYLDYGRGGWPEELKAHATNCVYCQKKLASAWNAIGHHPSEEQINDPNYENKLAVERHLNWHGCESCTGKIEKK
jgi:hypothetical protein